MKKKVMSMLLAVALIVGMIPMTALTAFAADDTIELKSSTDGQTIGVAGETTYYSVTSDTTELTNGVWLSDGETTFDETLYVNGSVTLYLKDNSQLTANKGIVLRNASVLNIVAESNGENMGKIVALGSGNGAGIGGSVALINNLNVNIYGGDIKATGYYGNAAIGGGINNKNVTVTIYGGIINADGGTGYSSGIGSGQGSTGCKVIIYDGTIIANGATNDGGAGIGGAYNSDCGIVGIYGGDITATGGGKAAGIGRAGTVSKNEGVITIGGGHITAIGGNTSSGKADAIKSRTVTVSPDEDEKIWLCAGDGTPVSASPFTEETDITDAIVGISELYKHIFIGGVCSCGAEGEFVIENGVLIKYNGAGGYIVIPDEVTSIGSNAFNLNNNIISVKMPNVTSVGARAFLACKILSDVDMPNVTYIGPEAFMDCTGLSFVNMPKVITVCGGAFKYCKGLRAAEMPDVISIGNKAFYNCINLEKLVMPNVTSIGDEAFYHCEEIKTFTVSDKVTVGLTPFANCSIWTVYYPCTSNVDTIKTTLKLKCKYIPIHDYADGICACGAKVLDFDSVSLVLSGELGLNFYTVVNDVETVKDGYMLFEIGNSGDTQKVYFKDLTAEDDGRYVFRCNINVLQMADTITAGFHYGDVVVGPRTTSVAQYLKNIVAKDPDNEELAALAHAIENYGHYAQIALQEVHGFTLGEDGKYQTMDGYGDIVLPDAADLADYKATKTGSITKISNVSRALALDHGTDILLYFTCADGYTPTATVTDKDGNAVACSLTKDESGRYILTIPNISAHKLGDFYTVSVDNGAMTIDISALSYAYSILNSATSSENLKYAVAALYNYYQAAIAYQTAHE